MVQSFRQGTQHAKLWPARYTKAGVPRPQGLSLRLFMPAVLLASCGALQRSAAVHGAGRYLCTTGSSASSPRLSVSLARRSCESFSRSICTDGGHFALGCEYGTRWTAISSCGLKFACACRGRDESISAGHGICDMWAFTGWRSCMAVTCGGVVLTQPRCEEGQGVAASATLHTGMHMRLSCALVDCSWGSFSRSICRVFVHRHGAGARVVQQLCSRAAGCMHSNNTR